MNSYTGQSDFTLVGFFSQSKQPALLAVVIFVVSIMVLILLIHSNTRLHTPMNMFISQVSLYMTLAALAACLMTNIRLQLMLRFKSILTDKTNLLFFVMAT